MLTGVIYSLGAVHGLILALLLGQKEVNSLPNKLLALLMVVFSVDLAMAALQNFSMLEQYPFLIGIDYPITLLYGPIFYLYFKTMRDGRSKLQQTDYLHFIPFAVLLIYMIPFYFGSATEKLGMLHDNIGTLRSTYGFGVINTIKVIHGLSYVAAIIYLLISYQKQRDPDSYAEKINLNWLQLLITGAALLAIIAGGIYFFSSAGQTAQIGSSGGMYDKITLLAVTGFVFGIGYMGLHQPEVFSRTARDDNGPTRKVDAGPKEKYQKSGLEEEQALHYQQQLIQLMEEQKRYRQSDLKLADLAKELGITDHNLTEVINRYIGQNFYDFVNSYRVKEVEDRLRDPESEEKTFLAIALDAGFNSKSTFNAVFKKQTGMTPSQYRRDNGANNK